MPIPFQLTYADPAVRDRALAICKELAGLPHGRAHYVLNLAKKMLDEVAADAEVSQAGVNALGEALSKSAHDADSTDRGLR